MAPSLSCVIRKKLELQGVQHAHIDTYLALLKSVDRYNRAFKKLFETLTSFKIDPWGGQHLGSRARNFANESGFFERG